MIMWLDRDSGTGYGVCSVGNMLAQSMMTPREYNKDTGRYDDDWPSTVAVKGPQDKYTQEELDALNAFGAEMTARYDEVFRYRMGCNLIIIDKYGEDSWMRKRQSWDYGSMFSPTLREALDTFRKGV